jgi:hypothetical protein
VEAVPGGVTPRASSTGAVVWGGATAGVLDIAAALTVYGLRGARPIRVLQAIASGLLGAEAFKGGTGTAALGLALHFLIAFTAAAVYVAASRRLRILVDRPVLAGFMYGALVYAVMNAVVLPLSKVAPARFNAPLALTILVVHMVCVGLPIALAARRYAPATRPT